MNHFACISKLTQNVKISKNGFADIKIQNLAIKLCSPQNSRFYSMQNSRFYLMQNSRFYSMQNSSHAACVAQRTASVLFVCRSAHRQCALCASLGTPPVCSLCVARRTASMLFVRHSVHRQHALDHQRQSIFPSPQSDYLNI
jgi:hypothetical protein